MNEMTNKTVKAPARSQWMAALDQRLMAEWQEHTAALAGRPEGDEPRSDELRHWWASCHRVRGVVPVSTFMESAVYRRWFGRPMRSAAVKVPAVVILEPYDPTDPRLPMQRAVWRRVWGKLLGP